MMPKFLLAWALTCLPLLGILPQSLADTEGIVISPETEISYDELEDLLAREKWRKANEATFDLLLEATDRTSQGWIDVESFKTMPCADLRIIDQLWMEYSQGHFGFSAQLPIFISTGNQPGRLVDEEAYDRFGDQVGWRRDGEWVAFVENLNFTLDAPTGHLPNPRYQYEITGSRLEYTTFAQRLVECEVVEDLPPIEPPSQPPSPLNINEPNLQI